MKVAIIGQQDFGKAVLEAFLARGDEVAAVFCAPEKEGARPDALRVAAQAAGVTVFQFPSLKTGEARDAMATLDADIGIMAFVLQFAPQDFVSIPRHGTIQYHPSLLPLYRGPSSINWPIIRGDAKTGLTIFRPTDGLDEGPLDGLEDGSLDGKLDGSAEGPLDGLEVGDPVGLREGSQDGSIDGLRDGRLDGL